MLLGHDVRNFYADIVARYGNLGQMLGRIAVAVWLVDRLEISLQKRRKLRDGMKVRSYGNVMRVMSTSSAGADTICIAVNTYHVIGRLDRLHLLIQGNFCLVGFGVSRGRHHTGNAHTQGGGSR